MNTPIIRQIPKQRNTARKAALAELYSKGNREAAALWRRQWAWLVMGHDPAITPKTWRIAA